MWFNQRRMNARAKRTRARIAANTFSVEHRVVYGEKPATPVTQVPRPTRATLWFKDENSIPFVLGGELGPRDRSITIGRELPSHIRYLSHIDFEFDTYGQERR